MFLFRLARDLGMTPGECARRHSSLEFTEWIAFYRIEAAEIKKAQKKR
jgi:hypothetical protein